MFSILTTEEDVQELIDGCLLTTYTSLRDVLGWTAGV